MNYISILCNNRISTTKSVSCVPHFYLKVVETSDTDVTIAAHAIA